MKSITSSTFMKTDNILMNKIIEEENNKDNIDYKLNIIMKKYNNIINKLNVLNKMRLKE